MPVLLVACGGLTNTQADAGRDRSMAAGGADGRPDADAGVEADESAPWTPDAVRGELAFWLDPTSLKSVNGAVFQWDDRSGNGNNAVQANPSFQPAYNPSGIGGLPSATFNGPVTFLEISDNPSMRWGTTNFAVFAVIRATSATTASFAMVYQKTGPGPAYDGLNLYINSAKPKASMLAAAQVQATVYVDNLAPPTTFVDSTAHVLGARRTGNTLEIRVDGTASNALTDNTGSVTVDISAVGASGVIGANGSDVSPEFQQVHGDIAELVAVRGALTAADLASLEAYLKGRYGIP
jgi:hypothetical protein